jgi:hypothetical protein
MKLPLFLMVFVYVYIHFRIWTRIRNPRVTDPDPAKVPDPDPQHYFTQKTRAIFAIIKILKLVGTGIYRQLDGLPKVNVQLEDSRE